MFDDVEPEERPLTILFEDDVDLEATTVSVPALNEKYAHINSNHIVKKCVKITDLASYKNPNSIATVVSVLRNIGVRQGIHRYGGKRRYWSFMCRNGLPFMLITKLKHEAVICSRCKQQFLHRKEFVRHHVANHRDAEISYVYKFDWIYVNIGAGHYDHNLLKAFLGLNWVPFF